MAANRALFRRRSQKNPIGGSFAAAFAHRVGTRRCRENALTSTLGEPDGHHYGPRVSVEAAGLRLAVLAGNIPVGDATSGLSSVASMAVVPLCCSTPVKPCIWEMGRGPDHTDLSTRHPDDFSPLPPMLTRWLKKVFLRQTLFAYFRGSAKAFLSVWTGSPTPASQRVRSAPYLTQTALALCVAQACVLPHWSLCFCPLCYHQETDVPGNLQEATGRTVMHTRRRKVSLRRVARHLFGATRFMYRAPGT